MPCLHPDTPSVEPTTPLATPLSGAGSVSAPTSPTSSASAAFPDDMRHGIAKEQRRHRAQRRSNSAPPPVKEVVLPPSKDQDQDASLAKCCKVPAPPVDPSGDCTSWSAQELEEELQVDSDTVPTPSAPPQPPSPPPPSTQPEGAAGPWAFCDGVESIGIMHATTGRLTWLPYQPGWTTEVMLRGKLSAQWRCPPDSFRLTRQSGELLMPDVLISRQCEVGEVLCTCPSSHGSFDPAAGAGMGFSDFRIPPPGCAPPMFQTVRMMPLNQPQTIVTQTPLFVSQGIGSGVGIGMGMGMALEAKLQHASGNLLKIVGHSKHCAELQNDLEQAVAQAVDCSCIFNAIERRLGELILHPAGNYLVTRCFDFCPALLDAASQMICLSTCSYCLHKHGSYVVEAILGHRCTPPSARSTIISQLISARNCFTIAAHETGNFVLQKCITCTPDNLLPQMLEAIRAVQGVSPHGARMAKKLDQRLKQSPNAMGQQKASTQSSSQSLQRVSTASSASTGWMSMKVMCAAP